METNYVKRSVDFFLRKTFPENQTTTQKSKNKTSANQNSKKNPENSLKELEALVNNLKSESENLKKINETLNTSFSKIKKEIQETKSRISKEDKENQLDKLRSVFDEISNFLPESKKEKLLKFITKRLAGDKIAIDDIKTESKSEKDIEKLKGDFIAAKNKDQEIENQNYLKTFDETISWLKPNTKEGASLIETFKNLSKKEVKELSDAIWKNHSKDLKTAFTEELNNYQKFAELKEEIDLLPEKEKTDFLKDVHERYTYEKLKGQLPLISTMDQLLKI